MHALLLAVALGQATPAAAPAEPEPAAAPASSPAPNLPETSATTSMPAPTPAATPALGGAARPLSPARLVELTPLPGGRFLATLDGEPVAGADFYRAVLRPDLAARLETARFERTALWIAAAAAPLVGAGAGWVTGEAQHRTVGCEQPVAPITDPAALAECGRVKNWNQATVRNSAMLGAGTGLVAGFLLWLGGRAITLPEPTDDEAKALVKGYRARTGAASGPGATLELEAGPGSGRVALRVRF